MRFVYIFLFVSCYCSTLSGQKIRAFHVNDIDGNAQSYDNIKGANLTVIDFWASWCKPCLKAIPKLEALHQKYKEQGVALLSINVDGPRSIAKVRPLVKSLGISSTILMDTDKQIDDDLDVYQIPTLLVVSDDNKIVYRHEGYAKGEEKEIEHVLVEHLSKNQ